MRTKVGHATSLLLLVSAIVLPTAASAQTAWFWARGPWGYTDKPSTLGIADRVANPRETVFGSVPRSGMLGEVAVMQSVVSIGDLVPLPSYADGSQATESETFWTAQLWRANFYINGQLEDCVRDASAMFVGRQLTGANIGWGRGPAMDVQVLVHIVSVRPHDNRKSNR
jgi:hypothetical protein